MPKFLTIVPEPAASALSWWLLEMQILRSLLNQKLWGESRNLLTSLQVILMYAEVCEPLIYTDRVIEAKINTERQLGIPDVSVEPKRTQKKADSFQLHIGSSHFWQFLVGSLRLSHPFLFLCFSIPSFSTHFAMWW